ncbi:MAG: HlyC/CorC family transporter [Saprospiraceae bacterium]|nr:HlyC/CorC family transporter [Saprospiraceae bacterium]
MELLIILILILINGIFSMSEIALVSARKNRLNFSAQKGNRGAKIALELQSAPSKLLSTVQIGITLIGLLTGIYSGEKITSDMEARILQIPFLAEYAGTLSIAVVLIIITFFSLVLGELVPKRIGLTYPEAIATSMALPMKIIATITAPFIWLLTATTDLILKVFQIKKSGASKVTEEEIKAIVKEGMEDGEIQEIEQDIVNRVFSVGDRSVSSLMTARKKMTTLDITDTKEEVKRLVSEDLHNFYPIYDSEEQDIIGIVSLKQLFAEIEKENFNLKNIVAEPSYIAEGASAYKALEQFKQTNVHYALVIDEYGSTQGILTMADILEALVGDISEFYGEEYLFQQRDDHTWLIDGHYPLPDFLTRFGMEDYIKDFEVNTVGGLIMQVLGRIPKQSEKIRWVNFEFEILDMDGPTIDKILITRK